MHRLEELVRLHRLGRRPREVARLLGMGPNTEKHYRRALAAAGLLDGPPDDLPSAAALKDAVAQHRPPKPAPQQQTSLEPWRASITALCDKGLKPRAIYDRLRLELGPSFDGSYWAVKRLWRAMHRARGVRPEQVAIPVETAPGEVAQVDFGYVGSLFDPATRSLRKAWCFVLVLGFSRHMVTRVAFDQRVETWLRLHVEAFEELGGVPKTIVPDNLKAAVVRAAFGADGPAALNRSYRELARHYGFTVDPTPPRDPGKKGKVEASVKYVKGNFFAGREGQDVTEVCPELARWTAEIAGRRVHGTTGRRPLEAFEASERAALLPLPPRPFEPATWAAATVHRDGLIAFGGRFYSVPWPLVGQRVWVRATASTVGVYAEDERVATHERHGEGPKSVRPEHLPDYRGELRHRSRDYWQERAERLDPEVASFVREVFDSDPALSRLRCAQALVLHLEAVPVERARGACRRARFFGSFSYGTVKGILARGLDLEPLPAAALPSPPPANDPPRFARPPSTWLARAQGARDEPGR